MTSNDERVNIPPNTQQPQLDLRKPAKPRGVHHLNHSDCSSRLSGRRSIVGRVVRILGICSLVLSLELQPRRHFKKAINSTPSTVNKTNFSHRGPPIANCI